MPDPGRDRLRELLDAVLEGVDEGAGRSLGEMAAGAYSSPYHFNRLLSQHAGEPPVAMRRRVMLERAAWQLREGGSVTDAAWAAGYESVEGFARAYARAFGHPPSTPATSHWLPAPNGIHFHPPTSLWVHAAEQSMDPVTEQLVSHDLDDTRHLLELAKQLPDDELRLVRMPGTVLMAWHGPEESIAAVLENHVWTKEVWLAALAGEDQPERDQEADAAALLDRFEAVAPRWLALVRDIDRRRAWEDRVIDALCEPPESFVVSGVVAHVITYAAHRRQLVRLLMRAAGLRVDHGDPINWLRARRGEDGEEEPW